VLAVTRPAADPSTAPGNVPTMNFVMEHFPPYIVDDNKGSGTGPFPELVRAVCDAMKIECTFKLLPWRRAYAMAEGGTAHGIFVLARTPEREKLFHFTDMVFQSSFVVLTRESAFSYAQPSDLGGFTIATYGPSAVSREMQELARKVPHVRLELEVDNRLVLRKLVAGRYPEPAAAVINRDVAEQLIAEEKLLGLKTAGEYKPVSYAIGLSRKKVSAEQAERFNAALRELVKQGVVKAIADKYKVKPAR
jgi:polar amino acid transport system substrate-binding protein